MSVRGLLEQLDPERYRVLVVPEKPGGDISEFFARWRQIADPAPPRRSLVPGAPIGPVKALGALAGIPARRRFLKEQGVDIVHTNDGRSHAGWALASRLAGARLVWHHRGDPSARGLRFVAPLLADRILTVSRFSLPAQGSRAAQRAQVVHSPFDTSVTANRETMRARILERIAGPADALLCGYFGNFIERKRPFGFLDSIEALAGLVDRPVRGLLFGDPRNSEYGERLPRRVEGVRGNARAHMMGFCSPGHAWLAGCDVLLVPAAREPLGRTLVEAMLVGTPVVATRSGGNPEALEGDCGILCELDDSRAMARAVARLLADPDRCEAMCARARRTARARFSMGNHADRVSAVYSALAPGGSAAD
ncbi:glycosyltransferase family 4 protein [Novosphingobium profundi]|nr:glycosyltransferase family 4 protein [Novosphingobium profundi]